ncbi:MAG TPA: Hsp20/alpha crystallin family protein [Tahibacter sp.]|uniref:Hsp20/alpha crystallin family protein n=1 Tax=Tahibacter sp. TaxID=2056211 RepID=UPI002B545228|nr:Hsp20/alpha crystallin family protein [Tahibacter sp.]HSX58557.1 Hsp20/alpha crystallin family protein [Tahibacter sp.]
MSISRNYRWSVPSGFQDEIKQAFERLFTPDESDQSNVVTSQWTPRVDIREEDKRFVILADIPGVDPNEIEIQMDKGILSIKGERKSDVVEGNGGKLSRSERTHGVFYRRFALPDSADADGITASGKFGVLEISIPKRPESSPRRINIAAH